MAAKKRRLSPKIRSLLEKALLEALKRHIDSRSGGGRKKKAPARKKKATRRAPARKKKTARRRPRRA